MAKREILIFTTFAALVFCTDVDDNEQKKRGVSKGTNLNTITTDAQKQDYTYSIYSQDQNSPSGQSTTYQSQVSNSFYPTQENSQYYSSPNSQTATSSYQPQQSHINASPQGSTQFIPLNFIPSSGYQSKYQIAPSKPNASVQLAFVQPPSSYQSPPLVPYSPSFYSPNPSNHHVISTSGQYSVPQNYQAFGGYLSHPSTMYLYSQPNPALYNNFVYPNVPNPVQNLYYPSQNKYNGPYASGSNEYDKLSQGIQVQKDDNGIAHNNEYASPSDGSSNYKSTYTSHRNTYSKI